MTDFFNFKINPRRLDPSLYDSEYAGTTINQFNPETSILN
jgi:hypothetical protein